MCQDKLLLSYSTCLGKEGLNYHLIRAMQNRENAKLA